MVNANKVTLLHPSTAPFVRQAALALHEGDLLESYITTLRYDPDSRLQRGLCALAGLAGVDLRAQLRRREISEIPPELLVSWPAREVIRTIAARIDRRGILTDRIWEWAETGFDVFAASRINDQTAAVYGYEHACLTTFEAARRRAGCCIYDVQAPEHDFTHSILQDEIARYPEADSPYQRYILQHQERRTARRRKEWELADLVIAASEFTRSSFAEAGLSTEKVKVIPYGAPPAVAESVLAKEPAGGPFRFLWAGTFSIRKGAHYLAQAWRNRGYRSDMALLRVFGAQRLPEKLVSALPDSICLSGTVPHSTLRQIYLDSDILVFPTLCDGFGMVVTEAFAHGLPVITTDRAGAADLVEDKVNGLVVEAGSARAIEEALEWCITNREKVFEMRLAALNTARSWQWQDYRMQLRSVVAASLD